MSWVKFSVAVVLTSAVLAIGIVGAGAFMVTNAVASGIQQGAAQTRMMDHGNVPPELAGLKDIPADQRFAHFKGVSVSLTDQNGQPLNIAVVPGVVSNVSATSLTLSGNDGTTHMYTTNDQTSTHGGTVSNGQDVVVVTINNSSTARAVFAFDPTKWHHN